MSWEPSDDPVGAARCNSDSPNRTKPTSLTEPEKAAARGVCAMRLKPDGIIEIPNSVETLFDHGAFEPKSRRVFVAHTARDCIEVIDHDTRRHLATLPDFPEAAGVVADQGEVLVTNRGFAALGWIDAETLTCRAVFDTGLR